jgi:beta-lactamase superfamily II metal-dependent hydrolase
MSIVKSLSVGDGDMFYINHGSDNFTIIDCCLSEWDRVHIVKELKSQSEDKGVVRFISTHPDDDHIRGLAYLHQKMNLLNFYCVKNGATKSDETDDFYQYCELRDDPKKSFSLSEGCSRKWMNLSDEERGSAGITICWPITTNEQFKEALQSAADGESPNNICPIIKYTLTNGASVLWMGDLETEFMESVKDEINVGHVDIMFAPHHGRDSGTVPAEWLEEIDPKIIVIGEADSEHLNYYDGYNTLAQNSAGDITLECETGQTNIYVSNDDYRVDFLEDELKQDTYGTYIGTLKVNT